MGKMSSTEIAEAIAASFNRKGVHTTRPQGGSGRFDFIIVRLPNGQEFKVQVEEVF